MMMALLAYFSGATPRARLANLVAGLVLWNQPFYPLYIYGVLGGRAWPSLATWASAPFFAAAPALGRRSEQAGVWLLLAASVTNTAICTIALGARTWVELFYAPCALLAGLLLDQPRIVKALVTALVIACAWAAPRIAGLQAGLPDMTPDEVVSLRWVHGVSVGCLMLAIPWLGRNLWRR